MYMVCSKAQAHEVMKFGWEWGGYSYCVESKVDYLASFFKIPNSLILDLLLII